MNIADVLITLVFFSALVRGIELGLLRQVCSTAGVVSGIFLGAFIQGKLIHLVHTPGSKALLALTVILAAIALCSTAGEYAGYRVKQKLLKSKFRRLDKLDHGAGSAVAGLTLLLVVWLGAALFSAIPAAGIQKQLQNSVIIAQLNKTLPPAPEVVSRIGHLIDPNTFPKVFTGLEPRIDTNKTLPSIGDLDAAVRETRASVVRIEGKGCGGLSQGTGFIADTKLVITNAHVVAGVGQPFVVSAEGRQSANVLHFDPDLDLAVLQVPGLTGQQLTMPADNVPNGTPTAILGYPGGGDFVARPSVIAESFSAVGRDIYNQGKTVRTVYSIRGIVRPGNSGGPLVNKEGNVVGVIFAQSTAYDDVGYALTTDQAVQALNQAKDRNQIVGTGSCTQ